MRRTVANLTGIIVGAVLLAIALLPFLAREGMGGETYAGGLPFLFGGLLFLVGVYGLLVQRFPRRRVIGAAAIVCSGVIFLLSMPSALPEGIGAALTHSFNPWILIFAATLAILGSCNLFIPRSRQ